MFEDVLIERSTMKIMVMMMKAVTQRIVCFQPNVNDLV